MMPFKKSLLIIFAAILVSAAPASALANVLGNPSFEQAIGSGTEKNWDSTNGATLVDFNTMPGAFTIPPPSGDFAILLDTTGSDDFTFQTHNDIKPGDYAVFSGLGESTANVAGQGGELCIEFRRTEGSITNLIERNCAAPVVNNAGTGYVRRTATGTAPEGTDIVVFVLRFTENNVLADGLQAVFDDLSAEVNPAKLSTFISKSQAKPGEVLTIVAQFANLVGTDFANAEFFSGIPKGFSLVRESVRVNGSTVQFREGSLLIPLGTLVAGSQTKVVYQVVVSNGVSIGHTYEFPIVIRNGNNLSETSLVKVQIEGDPLFDEGTIVGKVYNDQNKNGVQDNGEKGVPFVKLYTESGVSIVTDEHGRYHLPAVQPGRHVIKVDAHSLPEGTQFITEESFLVKTTPGLMNKASFAVYIPESATPQDFTEDLIVSVTQGLDTSEPLLQAFMEPVNLRLGVGMLEKDAIFRFNTNYSDFVKSWFLEVRNERGELVWTGFGVGAPPKEVVWTGQTEAGLMVKEGVYSYQLKVEDQDGHQDWSPLYFFKVVSKTGPAYNENTLDALPAVGDFNIFKDGKRSIPLVAKPTLRIQGKTKPESSVVINNYPVNVNPVTGDFQTEIYTSPGDKEIHVMATDSNGESTSYRKKVNVKDSMFFMVGLGEEQLGVNFQDGDLVTAGKDPAFKDGVYEDGRLSYYLKGKVKGKVLIKSHFDTAKTSGKLFTNLDPEDYYPVYGDASTRDYEAQNSTDKFYLLMEMDRSFMQWGSFKTAFTDTEIASYNRTLSGFKAHYETLGSTVYGDPKRGVTVFRADAQHRGAHDELAATGGSLYYLSHRNVLEGSEKLRVVVRDKIQEMDMGSIDLVEGQDYEIDYDQGRILLNKPLDSYAPSDVHGSADVASGSPKFLVADYEYDAGLSTVETTNQGIRGYTHLGQHIRVGGTAVEENRGNENYNLRGVDMTMKLGRNTKITSEYATSMKQSLDSNISFNGGMSYANMPLLSGHNTRPRENAYLVKAESKPVEKLEVSGYVQGVEPGFSNDHLSSQEGTKKYGLAAKYDFTEYLYSRYRFDHAEVIGQLMPITEHNIYAPFTNSDTHTAQIGYDDDQWLVEGEYMRQVQDMSWSGNLLPSIQSEQPFENMISGKLGYHINDKLLPYMKVQTTVGGLDSNKPNNQFGGGIRYKVLNGVHAYVEQLFGNVGDSTIFGFDKEHESGVKSYATLKMWDLGPGVKSLSTTIGNSFALTPKSRVYSERQHSSYKTNEGLAETVGLDHEITDKWSAEGKFERRHLDNAKFRRLDNVADANLIRTNTFNTVATALKYDDKKQLKAKFSVEVRRDQDAPRMLQWVTRNYIDYKATQSTSILLKLDYGKTRMLDPNDNPADFVEFDAGVAYRPIDNDKLQILTRYSYLRDFGNDFQFENFGQIDLGERAHIVAIDLSYDLTATLTTVEKLAFKTAMYDTAVTNEAIVNTILAAHRFNYHLTKKWDAALEYRGLWQTDAADTLRHGPLVEVDRELYDYVRLGVGYNFTEFSDNLRSTNNYDSHGPFVRLTGKF